MPDVLVRQAAPEDAAAISAIEEACFPDPWSYESLRFELTENPHAFYVVAEMDGEVVGYVGLWWLFDEGHITNVAVLPGYRNRHIAEGMMNVMIGFTVSEGVRHHTLEVRPSNGAAIALYEKLGFVTEGRRKKYYKSDGEDALIMWRHEED